MYQSPIPHPLINRPPPWSYISKNKKGAGEGTQREAYKSPVPTHKVYISVCTSMMVSPGSFDGTSGREIPAAAAGSAVGTSGKFSDMDCKNKISGDPRELSFGDNIFFYKTG